MTTQPETALTTSEKATIATQAILRGVPCVGAALEHLIFGDLNELRMKRIERTLTEVATALGETEASRMASEGFVNLLESVTPDLARSISEERRLYLKDLLLNAAKVVTQDPALEEAHLAASLLKEIEPSGLAILAALSHVPEKSTATLASRPVSVEPLGSDLGNLLK